MSAPLVLASARLAEVAGVRHGFSTRVRAADAGGPQDFDLGARHREVGALAADRRRFVEALGLAADAPLVLLRQVHGDRILTVAPDGGWPEGEGGHDAVISTWPGAAIGIQTADCTPVLIAAPGRGVVAAAHAGWRSTAASIVVRVVRRLVEEHGCAADELVAAIGPCIGPCCFEVGEEVVEELAPSCGRDESEWVVRAGGAKPHVDLVAVNRAQLVRAGVAAARVDVVAPCTRCDVRRFHSYRRDGAASGRQISAVALVA